MRQHNIGPVLVNYSQNLFQGGSFCAWINFEPHFNTGKCRKSRCSNGTVICRMFLCILSGFQSVHLVERVWLKMENKRVHPLAGVESYSIAEDLGEVGHMSREGMNLAVLSNWLRWVCSIRHGERLMQNIAHESRSFCEVLFAPVNQA